MLFVGPSLLAGIGQVTRTYALSVGGEFVTFGDKALKDHYPCVFIFALPLDQHVEMIEQYYKKLAPRMILMTVCETETVHPDYAKLLKVSDTIYCPSEFAAFVLQRQFPQGDFKVLHHWVQPVPKSVATSIVPYTFYTIGNIMDPRKNIRMLIEAFMRLNMKDCRLVLKATCKQPVEWKFPNVQIINGILSDKAMDDVHDMCHCYVNCSHSEGVGMGAVEAAMRDKPVIITKYGGLKEYVQTPYVVDCTVGEIGFDDFLYTKNLKWGQPSLDSLMHHMKECYDKRLETGDHTFSRNLVSAVPAHISKLAKLPGQQKATR